MGALRIPENRRYGPPRLAPGIVLACVGAVAAAAAAGWAVAHGLPSSPAPPAPPRPLSIGLPDATIELRAAWRPAARPVAIPGLARARAFAPADGTAGQLVVALAPGARVLPGETVAALRLPQGGQVRMKVAGRPAVGYRALALRGVTGLADIYAVPTVAGTLRVACVAPLANPLSAAACPGDILAIAAHPPPDPAPALRSRAPAILGRLGPIRTAGRAALKRARTAREQAAIAGRLAAAYAVASASTAKVTPSSDAGAALARAFGEAAAAYDRLASAARQDSRPGWSRARRAVSAAERRVREALRF